MGQGAGDLRLHPGAGLGRVRLTDQEFEIRAAVGLELPVAPNGAEAKLHFLGNDVRVGDDFEIAVSRDRNITGVIHPEIEQGISGHGGSLLRIDRGLPIIAAREGKTMRLIKDLLIEAARVTWQLPIFIRVPAIGAVLVFWLGLIYGGGVFAADVSQDIGQTVHRALHPPTKETAIRATHEALAALLQENDLRLCSFTLDEQAENVSESQFEEAVRSWHEVGVTGKLVIAAVLGQYHSCVSEPTDQTANANFCCVAHWNEEAGKWKIENVGVNIPHFDGFTWGYGTSCEFRSRRSLDALYPK